MATKAKKKPMQEAPSSRSLGSSSGLRGFTVKLPIAYLAILEEEAKHVGVKRGAFLWLLLRRKRKELPLERPPSAPTYSFSDEQLKTSKLWMWYVTPEQKDAVDADRMQMGVGQVSTWVTQMLNQWIGKPGGLRS